jgi:hypothetical protein
VICLDRKQEYFFKPDWTAKPNHRRIERFFVALIEPTGPQLSYAAMISTMDNITKANHSVQPRHRR